MIRGGGPEAPYEALPVDTEEQCQAAVSALRYAGMKCVEVYAGDPDGDHYPNGQKLFAADINDYI